MAAAAVLFVLLGAAVFLAVPEGHRSLDDCVSYHGLVPTTPSTITTDWAWRRLEWECVYTDHRTGRQVRVDIDDARREIARH